MDPAVFIKWWFSWASNMKINFRKPCPVCKHTPKQLACDGTKIGVGFRHASFDEISKPDDPGTVLPTLHCRMTRCFLTDRNDVDKYNLTIAKEHLNYIAKSTLNEIPVVDVLSDEEIHERNRILLQLLNDKV